MYNYATNLIKKKERICWAFLGLSLVFYVLPSFRANEWVIRSDWALAELRDMIWWPNARSEKHIALMSWVPFYVLLSYWAVSFDFRPFYRTEQLIFTPDPEVYPGGNEVFNDGTIGDFYIGPAVKHKSFLEEVRVFRPACASQISAYISKPTRIFQYLV